MSQSKDLQIFQMLSTLLVSISGGEHILQCIRQVLTSHPLFNPMSIFKYLTKGSHYLMRKNISNFLEENNFHLSQQQVLTMFRCYGLRDQMQYTHFLNYIYPSNSGIIRQITTTHAKRYRQTEKLPIHEQVITGLFILLTEQIKFIRKIEAQKNDFFPKMPKQKLRKILKSIKKASEKQHSHSLNKQNVITSLELRNFIKAFIDVGDYQFLHLGRKLNMDKNGLISLQQLEFWLKPWKKTDRTSSLTPKKNNKEQKQFNQQQYRISLRKQFAQQFNIQDNQSSKISPIKSKINKNQCFKKFKEFIEKFLQYSKQLQKIKEKFNSLKINMMNIFKKIDKDQKGVISNDDLKRFYFSIGGIPTNLDFKLLTQRYSHSQNNNLTLSQFCEIFNSNQQHQTSFDKNNNYISQQSYRVMSQILNLSLQSQSQLKKVRSKFNKGQARQLFDMINKEQSGFINYQEMKKFVSQMGKSLSMQQLMLILKTLDKTKNGVVLQTQFINYFQNK